MKFVSHAAATATALFLLFGAMVPSFAQRGQQGDRQGKPDKHEGGQQQDARPPGKQQHAQGQAQRPEARRQQTMKGPQAQERGQSARQPQPRQGQSAQPAREQQRQHSAQQSVVQQRSQQQWGNPPQRARPQQQPLRTRQQAVVWQQQRGWLRQGGWQGRGTWGQSRAQRWEQEHRSWAQRGGYGGYYIPQDRFNLYFGSQHWFRMRTPTIYMGYPRFSYSGVSFMMVDPWPEFWQENWYETDDVYVDYDNGYYLHNRRHPGIRLAITVAM